MYPTLHTTYIQIKITLCTCIDGTLRERLRERVSERDRDVSECRFKYYISNWNSKCYSIAFFHPDNFTLVLVFPRVAILCVPCAFFYVSDCGCVCVCVSEIHALIHIKRIRLCEHCNLLYRCNKQSWIYLNWLQPNHWKTPKNNETMKSPNQRCRIQPFESAKLEQYLRIKIIMLAAWFVTSQKLCIELRPLHFHRKYTHTILFFFHPLYIKDIENGNGHKPH